MNKLFGMAFYNKTLDDLVSELNEIIRQKKQVSIFTPNVDHIINIKQDLEINEKYLSSDYIIADGWPLVATAKFKGINISRITGVDLMDALLKKADNEQYKLFFLGATDNTLELLKKNIANKYPNIPSIDSHNGFFEDNKLIIDKINKFNPNIIFVGMGNPKQEMWIIENKNKLNTQILVGVGGAFNIFSEEISRSPLWIQKVGLEWFYRFLKEPKRLFSRYFIKYPKYLKYMCKEVFGEKNEKNINY